MSFAHAIIAVQARNCGHQKFSQPNFHTMQVPAYAKFTRIVDPWPRNTAWGVMISSPWLARIEFMCSRVVQWSLLPIVSSHHFHFFWLTRCYCKTESCANPSPWCIYPRLAHGNTAECASSSSKSVPRMAQINQEKIPLKATQNPNKRPFLTITFHTHCVRK